MIVYRLSRSKYATTLDGRGAELAGGRWNSRGIPVVYTGENISLCMAEVAVHLPLGILPLDYRIVTIDIPDNEICTIPKAELSAYRIHNIPLEDTRRIGDRFFTKEAGLILKVPSIVVQGEFNFLINPRHHGIKEVKIIKSEAFSFDERLFIR